MKKIIISIIFVFVALIAYPQSSGTSNGGKLFQRLVIDIGASPVIFSDRYSPKFTFYNFALGYQFSKRFDLRIQTDIINIYQKNDVFNWSEEDKMIAIGLGANYRVYFAEERIKMAGKSLSVAAKMGFAIFPESRMQQSICYDLAARLYPGRNYYFAVGLNHQLFTNWNPSNIPTLYLGFGLDF